MPTRIIEFPEQKITAEIETPEMLSGIPDRSTQPKPPKMVSLKEASAITGLSYSALRKLCLKGEIVHIRVGTKFLINLDRLIDKLNGKGSTFDE